MNVLTKRNALIGWIVMRIARRRVERKLSSLVGRSTQRRTLVAGLGLTAVGVGTTIVLIGLRDRSADAKA